MVLFWHDILGSRYPILRFWIPLGWKTCFCHAANNRDCGPPLLQPIRLFDQVGRQLWSIFLVYAVDVAWWTSARTLFDTATVTYKSFGEPDIRKTPQLSFRSLSFFWASFASSSSHRCLHLLTWDLWELFHSSFWSLYTIMSSVVRKNDLISKDSKDTDDSKEHTVICKSMSTFHA